jgi:hypothetical protein
VIDMGEQPSAAELTARIDDLAAQVAGLTSDVTDLASAVYAGDLSAPPATTTSPRYATLDGWVHEYFAPTFGRLVGGELRWCADWQQHAEAITRLEALWRSWEALRLDPAVGMATWLSHHLDQQLPILLGRQGPFSQCNPDRHVPATPLPLTGARFRGQPERAAADPGVDGGGAATTPRT